MPQPQKLEHLMHALETHPTACLWVIDGITDFVASANDEQAGNVLVGHLMQKSSENNAAIILLIHENGNNGKLRGHIGSEAERKCGGAISVKKDRDKGVHFIEPKYLRDAEDFAPVVFKWSNDLGRMVSVDASTARAAIQEQKDKSKEAQLSQLYEKCIGVDKSLLRTEFRKRIEHELDPNKQSTPQAREQKANRNIEAMKGYYIKLNGTGKTQTVEPFLIIDNPTPYQDAPTLF